MISDILNIHKRHPAGSFGLLYVSLFTHISISVLFFLELRHVLWFFCRILGNNFPGGEVLALFLCPRGRSLRLS